MAARLPTSPARSRRWWRWTRTSILDTGLIPFRERFPERFFECGIAEQDMVSQAGAMALAGLLPVVHSFACFLSTRPNEQIYNNATEGTKVIYVGSLAGLVPGGPGHSHQSVRDISALGAMPGMALIEPASEHETRLAVEWAVREAAGPVYIRLVSVPWELGFEPPVAQRLVPGRGELVRAGPDALIVTTGPVMLSQAWRAAEALGAQGRAVGVLSLPWLRGIDGEWLAALAGDAPVVCVDNHYVDGGQGDAVLSALPPRPAPPRAQARRRVGAGVRHQRRGPARPRARRRQRCRADRRRGSALERGPLLGHRRHAADDRAGRRLRARGGRPRGGR